MTDLQYVMNALSKAQAPMMDGSHQPDYRECARAIRRAHRDIQEMAKALGLLIEERDAYHEEVERLRGVISSAYGMLCDEPVDYAILGEMLYQAKAKEASNG